MNVVNKAIADVLEEEKDSKEEIQAIIDSAILGITVTSTDSNTSENGDTANFTMVLTSQPSSNVVINIFLYRLTHIEPSLP